MAVYDGPMIDTDVHHNLIDAEVAEYLSPHWREYVAGKGRPLSLFPVTSTPSSLLPGGGARADSYPGIGRRPGSDYELLRAQLLDKYRYERAVLTHNLGDFASHANHLFTAELCRAVNDWNLEHWLARDDRLYSVVVVPTSLPEVAADEIRRVGKSERMVGVLFSGNPIGLPYGDPILHPIYEAAAELDLPIVFHIGADRPNSQIRAVGGPKWNVMMGTPEAGQSAMHYISSFIVNGVFEKFPRLQLLFNEYGVTWLPGLVWRLDENVALLRHESPWVKRLPSEYIHDHIRLSTQPLEESPDDKGAMVALLETVDGVDDMLCYSSDYPHLSFDDPTYVARMLPARWHPKVFHDNAATLFGWAKRQPRHAQSSGSLTQSHRSQQVAT
jgi:predicted TIM-barrel fold metal-dependent hydrolase